MTTETTNINAAYISGEVVWVKYDREHAMAIFSLRNRRGSFYVEARMQQPPDWQAGAWLLVDGELYSRFWRGKEQTRIQARNITALR